MAEETIGIREFGRAVGRSHVWVLGKIKEGKIPVIGEGRGKKIPMDAGFEAVKKLIRDEEGVQVSEDDGEDKPESSFKSARSIAEATNKAKCKKEIFLAEMKKLEYEVRKGQLVEKSAVIAEGHAIGSAMRQQLMAIPVRVAGLCEGRTTREIEEILEDAINDALTVFQKSEFFKK